MDRNARWRLKGLAVVTLAAACTGNLRTPLATDTPPISLSESANARLARALQTRGIPLPTASRSAHKTTGTTPLPDPCAVNDSMPIGRGAGTSVPMPNGAVGGLQKVLPIPNPCVVAPPRK